MTSADYQNSMLLPPFRDVFYWGILLISPGLGMETTLDLCLHCNWIFFPEHSAPHFAQLWRKAHPGFSIFWDLLIFESSSGSEKLQIDWKQQRNMQSIGRSVGHFRTFPNEESGMQVHVATTALFNGSKKALAGYGSEQHLRGIFR